MGDDKEMSKKKLIDMDQIASTIKTISKFPYIWVLDLILSKLPGVL